MGATARERLRTPQRPRPETTLVVGVMSMLSVIILLSVQLPSGVSMSLKNGNNWQRCNLALG
jgi:hypothetical protein